MKDGKRLGIIERINLGDQLTKREKMLLIMAFTWSYCVNYLRERENPGKRSLAEWEGNNYFEFGIWHLSEYICSTVVESQRKRAEAKINIFGGTR